MDNGSIDHPSSLSNAPDWLIKELRSDHAGETGAVFIYRGILAVSRDQDVRIFAAEHLQTEQSHLDEIETIFQRVHHSRLLPAWRVAGWLTGAFPAVFGSRAVFATIEAVETFVDAHYTQQIDALDSELAFQWLRDVMIRLRDDERHHRDDANVRLTSPNGLLLSCWAWIVGFGSETAVKLARRL